MIADVRWDQLSGLEGSDLKGHVFTILQQAATSINGPSGADPKVLEVVPRLADLIENRDELSSFREAFGALARATGLFNYIDKESADEVDVLIAETVTVPELGGITLHREQVAALNELLSGKNLVLSAPTSFGKSLRIDALLASGRYRRVAIVLPTIALLDEFRRRLRSRFRDLFRVVMHPSDLPTEGPTIFLGTQERLINRDDLGSLDLTVVDEFYKLDPSRRDERSITLNAAVYKLLNRSRQFFFLGPNIDNVQVQGEGRWKFEFLKTRFSTVAVDTYDLNGEENKEERLLSEIGEDDNWPALVFVSSPDKANKLAFKAAEQMAVSDESADFAEWLSDNVGSEWGVVRSVEYGFGVHHGRIPRAIASQMIRYFNQGRLPVLFCTSTLIEGVNTAAKSVLIYDKKINKANYDFFTFSNIKGRAGRLGQHHVGRVFIFNSPPGQETMEVSPTLFSDNDEAPDDYVVHLDDRSPRVDDRITALQEALGLDRADLRLAASVGLENAAALKEEVERGLKRGAPLLWSGSPDYKEILALVEVICTVRSAQEFGLATPNQLTYYINILRRPNTMRGFLLEHNRSYKGSEFSHDNVFKFLRACEYGLPQYMSTVEMFLKKKRASVDYSFFVQSLSRWFRPEELKNLDEEGVPIQISERFYRPGDTLEKLVEKLVAASRSEVIELSSFERRWILEALEA